MSITCHIVNPIGFCFGVKKAVSFAEKAIATYGKVYITEDIIHNSVFMKTMTDKGVVKVESIDDVPNNNAFLISAHGVSPEFISKCKEKELKIIDATCPIVKSIQNSISENSEDNNVVTIIIGKSNHAEVIGMVGYTGDNNNVFVVSNEEEVLKLPDYLSDSKVFYYTQTTFDSCYIDKIVDALISKIPNIRLGAKPLAYARTTICGATIERQEAIKKIASQVDLVIIVGSSHSSNTLRLAEIAENSGAPKVIRINSKNELDNDILKGVTSVAIASGASTPEQLVDDIVRIIENYSYHPRLS